MGLQFDTLRYNLIQFDTNIARYEWCLLVFVILTFVVMKKEEKEMLRAMLMIPVIRISKGCPRTSPPHPPTNVFHLPALRCARTYLHTIGLALIAAEKQRAQ